MIDILLVNHWQGLADVSVENIQRIVAQNVRLEDGAVGSVNGVALVGFPELQLGLAVPSGDLSDVVDIVHAGLGGQQSRSCSVFL